jgi:hypothetical protein
MYLAGKRTGAEGWNSFHSIDLRRQGKDFDEPEA